VTLVQPSAVRAPDAFSHATLTDDTDRHMGANGKVMEPVVMLSSVYVPSPLAVHVPVTWREPVTGTVVQPRLARETSMSPERARHDDATVQLPMTEPPQGVALGQLDEGPDVPPPPPMPLDPPEPGVPPVAPAWLPELVQPLPVRRLAKATVLTSPMSLICMRPRQL
jgi:hypothetical protein